MRRRLLLVLAVLAAALCARCRPGEEASVPQPAPSPPPPAVRPVTGLEPRTGFRSAGELVGRESRGFTVEVPAGWFLEVVVEQKGIDLAVTVSGPKGEGKVTIDTPTGDRGPEVVPFIVAAGGRQMLTLQGGEAEGRGSFELRIEALRPAGDRDRARAEAVALDAAGAATVDRAAAERFFQRALERWRDGADPRGESLTWRRLGEVERFLGKKDQEVHCYREALRLVRQTGDRFQEVRVLGSLGTAERSRGEWLGAEVAFRSFRAAALAAGDFEAEGLALGNLGSLSQDRGELAQALIFYDHAVERLERWGEPREVARLLHNRGTMYLQLNRLEDAQDSLYKALDLRRKIGDKRGEAKTLLLLGEILAWQEEPRAALRYLHLAWRLAREQGDLPTQASTLDKLGIVYLGLGRLSMAGSALRQAAALFERMEADDVRLGWAEINQGRLQEALGKRQEALASYRRAQNRLGDQGERTGEAAALYQQASLLRTSGDIDGAMVVIEKAVVLLESLGADAPAFSLQSSYLAPRRSFRQLWSDLLMIHGQPARALEVSEQNRARGFLEALATSPTELRRGAPAPLLAEARRLTERINAVEQSLQDPATPAVAREGLESALRTLLLDYDKLQARLRSAPTSLEAPSLSAPEIQALLDEETLFLVYELGVDRSFLWVVGRRSIDSYVLPPREKIEILSRRAWELLSRTAGGRGSRRTWRVLSQLGDAILAPAAARLGRHRLAIVADGALRDVPFAALPVPGSGEEEARPLIQDHEIAVLESPSVLALLRKRLAGRLPAPLDAAVLADPVYSADDIRITGRLPKPGAGGSLPRLPATRKEAELLRSLIPPERLRIALDFEASSDLVASGELRHYRILHFATHGLLNPRHPELSSLVFSLVDEQGHAKDGRIRAYELFDLDLPADLTVLSACRTLPDALSQGEGVVGMARGFMVAGSPRVVVSLWNVNDSSTAVLMEHFYRGILVHGLRPAAALREAQIALLTEDRGRLEDPYYWAPFVLEGDWR